MIRDKIFNEYGLKSDFKLRGKDVGRLEALSDGVFSLAIGLLVVSSQVPKTFKELMGFMEDFPAFFICIIMVVMIWRMHYVFFLRYGLRDRFCMRVNIFLLFLVLFYIYPLKFLFSFCAKWIYLSFAYTITHHPELAERYKLLFKETITPLELPVLSVIYGLGLGLIFICFALLYAHAYRKREYLEFNTHETYETLNSRNWMWVMGGISFISVIVAGTGYVLHKPIFSFYSGMVYWLIPLGRWLHMRLSKFNLS
jgi:uncharacterized membrane protein